ncbi:MAG: ComEC/Rec2 family competence protein [Leptospirales bacterium]|nr:ComEC/Rec2 family competence protein [Leptospirales bacterium]
MPPFAAAARLLALGCALLICWRAGHQACVWLAALGLAALLPGIVAALNRRASWRGWIGAAILLLLAALRLAPQWQTAPPPGQLLLALGEAAAQQPRYDRAYRLQAQVVETIRPGLYIIESQSGYVEERQARRPGFSRRRGGAEDASHRPRRYAAQQRRRNVSSRAAWQIRRSQAPVRWRARWNPLSQALATAAPFRIAVSISGQRWMEGCRVELRFWGRGAMQLAPPEGYGQFLQRRGVYLQSHISPRYQLIGTNCASATWRGRLLSRLEHSVEQAPGLDAPARSAMLALLIGRSSYLDRQLRADAALTGSLHLFAASGLHLAILFVCLHWPLARVFGARHPLALWPGVALCAVFTLALGAPASLLRAQCFLLLTALRSLIHRPLPPREALLHAAWLCFLLRPQEMLSPGAALSFAAAGGILYYFRDLERRVFDARTAPGRWLATQGAVSAAAGLLTAPLLQFLFRSYAWLALPLNMILVPLAGLLLPALYGGAALSLCGVSDSIAALVLWPAAQLLQLAVKISAVAAGVAAVFPPAPAFLAGLCGLALWITLRRLRQTTPARRSIWRCLAWLTLATGGPPGALALLALQRWIAI